MRSGGSTRSCTPSPSTRRRGRAGRALGEPDALRELTGPTGRLQPRWCGAAPNWDQRRSGSPTS
jgi:hypothetical protein